MSALRSLADQSEQQLGGTASVLVRQRREHAELERLLVQVDRAQGASQDEVLTALGRLVFPHAYAEEVVLFPVVRAVLPDGHERTLRIEREHQEVNELWSALERTPHGDPDRAALLERLAVVLREDARDEEDDLLPRLQAALDAGPAARGRPGLGAGRPPAPTRPHALVSRRLPGNALSGVPLAVLDRSRDVLDRRGRGLGPAAEVARRASAVLATVAGALEHLPPFRAGQDPRTRAGATGRQPAGPTSASPPGCSGAGRRAARPASAPRGGARCRARPPRRRRRRTAAARPSPA